MERREGGKGADLAAVCLVLLCGLLSVSRFAYLPQFLDASTTCHAQTAS